MQYEVIVLIKDLERRLTAAHVFALSPVFTFNPVVGECCCLLTDARGPSLRSV